MKDIYEGYYLNDYTLLLDGRKITFVTIWEDDKLVFDLKKEQEIQKTIKEKEELERLTVKIEQQSNPRRL